MEGISNKVAIVVAVIGALATIVSAYINASLKADNVVLVNDNTVLQNTISELEQRLSNLEQSKLNGDNIVSQDELNRLAAENQKLVDENEQLSTALQNQSKTLPTNSQQVSENATTHKPSLSKGVGVYTKLSDRYKDWGVIVDNQGNSHEHSISNWVYKYADHSFPIDLDYQYKKISGVFFQNGYYSMSPANTTLTIYKDGEYSGALWQQTVNGNSEAMPFEVDISGLKTIWINLSNASTTEQPPAFFEAYLWK